MTIKEFIEDAKRGGWTPPYFGLVVTTPEDSLMKESRERWRRAGTIPATDMEDLSFSAGYGEGQRHVGILLDPAAWMAVAKVRDWAYDGYLKRDAWISAMHGMTDFLAEGKSIGEYLETL